MKTTTWYIYSDFYYPFWDAEDGKLIWINGDRKRLDLPECISTAEEAEEFLEQSARSELGTEYVDWCVREY